MGTINMPRVLVGGVVAGIIIWIIEGAASMLYMDEMEAAMEAHNLAFEMSAGAMFITILVSLIFGLVAVWFYAAVRPRFGPGPKTAVMVAVALWLAGYVTSLLGYDLMELFPRGLLASWGLVGLVEIILATLAGAWLYKEA